MPIEIKELHIRVTVSGSQNAQVDAGGSAVDRGISDHVKDALVAECVEQVLQILQNKAEALKEANGKLEMSQRR